MSLNMLVRAATDDDIEHIARIHQDLNRPRRTYNHPGEFLVASSDGCVVGCAGMALHGEAAYFYGLAVTRDWQRRGVGSRLMQARLDVLQGTRVRFAVALVMFWNSRFFRKFLFASIKRKDLPASAQVFDELTNPVFRNSAVMLRNTVQL